MSQIQGRVDSANSLSSPYDSDQTMFSRSFGYSSPSPPQDELLSSPSYANVDSAGTLPVHGRHSHGSLETEERLDQSLASLGLEGNDSFPNSDMSNNIFDRETDIGIQQTFDSVNPRLSLACINNSIHRAHTTSTSLQVPNAVKSSSSWRNPDPWSVESSANLCPPTYTPHKSCASTHSHHSDNTWETYSSIPSPDDFDIRPMPDDNSASMQSCNHPRIGIWEVQESPYGGHTIDSYTRNTCDGDGIDPPKVQYVSPNLQQVVDDAEAATPFGTVSHFDGDVLPVDGALGGYGNPQSAISPLLTPSTTRGLVPQFNRALFGARPEVSIEINDTRDFGGFSVQPSPEVEQYFDRHSSDRNFLPNRPPRFALDVSPPPASSSTSAVLTDPPIPVLTPSTSADQPTTNVAVCPHCSKEFNGEKRMDTLRRHKRLKHKNRPELECPLCQRVFESGRPDNLKRHFRTKHPNDQLPASLNVRGARFVPSRRHR